MAEAVLDIPAFRVQFPEFADATAYPDDFVTIWWQTAVEYINVQENSRLQLPRLQYALNLMLAHLLYLGGGTGAAAMDGGAAGIETSATISSVSVSVQAPPFGTSQYKFWLSQSRYGQLLLALMGRVMAGGFYIGGSLDRAAFRRM